MLEQGIPAEHIIIGGDSGGGGLTTILLMGHLRDEGLPRPAAIALFSPEVNLQFDRPSVTENAGSDVLPWSIPVTSYLQGMSPGDERVSAVNAVPHETWWPPTFVCWGEKEMFRDGIRTFAEHLEASDVKVKAMEEPGMFHAPTHAVGRRCQARVPELREPAGNTPSPLTAEVTAEDALYRSRWMRELKNFDSEGVMGMAGKPLTVRPLPLHLAVPL